MSANRTSVLSAIDAIRDDGKAKGSRKFYVLLLMALFFVMLLIALALGVSVYSRVANIQMETNESRLGLQLVSNYVRANDTEGAVKVGTGPEGRSLVLLEELESGKYETRIYLYDGSIVEEYAIAGTPYTPGKATRLVDSQKFSFSYSNGLLTLTTDQGSAEVALRTSQGGR